MPNDFIQYWTAFQLLIAGENPYDPEKLWQLQQLQGLVAPPVIFMWNPPWLLVLLAPILILPFALASELWQVCQGIFIFSSLLLSSKIFNLDKKSSFGIVLLGLIFYPMWEALLIGQISNLLLFALCLAFYLISRGKDFSAGLFLSVLFVKPHLFLLVFLALAIWTLQSGRTKWICGLCVSFSLQIVAVLSLSSQVLLQWYQSMHLESSALLITRQEWMTATVATWLRVAVRTSLNRDVLFFPWIVALVGLVGGVTRLTIRKKPIIWNKDLAWILSLSLLLAPYGWLFDFSLLLPVYLFSLTMLRNREKSFALVLLICIQVTIFLCAAWWLPAQHHYAWVPLVMLLFAVFSEKEKQLASTEALHLRSC